MMRSRRRVEQMLGGAYAGIAVLTYGMANADWSRTGFLILAAMFTTLAIWKLTEEHHD